MGSLGSDGLSMSIIISCPYIVSHSALLLVDAMAFEVKSIPGFVSFLEDSEDETETESEQSEERH